MLYSQLLIAILSLALFILMEILSLQATHNLSILIFQVILRPETFLQL